MGLNLRAGIDKYLQKYGTEEVATQLGKTANYVALWASGKNPTVADVQFMIDNSPECFDVAADTVEVLAPYEIPSGQRVCVLMPTNRSVHPGVVKAFATLYERDKMQFFTLSDTSIVRSRNACAQRFLDSNCEYSFWLDDDTILPHGDVDYYRKVAANPNFPSAYININPIARLIQTKRTLVGGCYFGRNPTGVAQFQEAYSSQMVNDAAHNGPRNSVDPVGWVGFGCVLVHRSVFEDIIKTQPEIEVQDQAFVAKFGYKYRFFNHITEEYSEDASFCIRAKKAGHQTYVDYAVMPLHVGEAAYCYHNTTQKRGFQPQYSNV